MTLTEVLQELEIPEAHDLLLPHWDESMAGLPDSGIPFLDPHVVKDHRSWAELDATSDTQLLTTAKVITEHPALNRLAWHCYRLLFVHTEYGSTASWPSLQKTLGTSAGTFYLLVAMAMIPLVKRLHQSMGVDATVTHTTCQQISCFASNYMKQTGNLGISLRQIYWLRHYTAGQLFRLGRLEYMLRPFSGAVHVYRHKITGQVVALAADGTRYDTVGYVEGKAESTEQTMEPQSWSATLTVTSEQVIGYPISPKGYALKQAISLPLRQWEAILTKGNSVLDMHIPEGGGMTLERCAESFKQAASFFKHYFPDQPFNAITCSSWIFNTQLADLKLSSNNLVSFQEELYLFPTRSSGRDGLWFIFLQDEFDPQTAPRKTSLQREIIRYLQAGHRWRGGGMFFLVEHIDQFGTQYYRKPGSTPLSANGS